MQRLVVVDLTDNEFGALVSFTFNVGKGNFAKSELLKLVNKGYKEAASRRFGAYIASKGKILNGLIRRRACEAVLYSHGLKGDVHGEFSMSECESLGAAPTSSGVIDIDSGEPLPELQRDR